MPTLKTTGQHKNNFASCLLGISYNYINKQKLFKNQVEGRGSWVEGRGSWVEGRGGRGGRGGFRDVFIAEAERWKCVPAEDLLNKGSSENRTF